jgi:hypothetical protein
VKRFTLAIVTMLILVGRLSGQPATPSASEKPASRSSYDPMAQGKGTGQPAKGIIETTLAGVNPQNKDYGAVIADWRKEIVEQTVRQVYFWSLIALSLALGCSIMAIGWLLRERQNRLSVSADIVAQLYNAYVGSRAKALDVIARYNKLVERYNRLDEDFTAVKAKLEAAELVSKTEVPSEFHEVKGGKPAEMSPAAAQIRNTEPGEDGVEENVSEVDPVATIEQLQAKLKRKDAQVQAKDNQITNLRNRLTRAHDSLQGQRAGLK